MQIVYDDGMYVCLVMQTEAACDGSGLYSCYKLIAPLVEGDRAGGWGWTGLGCSNGLQPRKRQHWMAEQRRCNALAQACLCNRVSIYRKWHQCTCTMCPGNMSADTIKVFLVYLKEGEGLFLVRPGVDVL